MISCRDGKDFRDFEVTHDFPRLGRRVMLINARKVWTEENDSHLVLMAIEDVTERKRIHDELVHSMRACSVLRTPRLTTCVHR